jgi:hypothetical protein
MAYPLFIVVVGVDPHWVKNALIKKHSLQFAGKIYESDSINKDLEIIDPSSYLEKIFQIPFHLKEATDENIKNMIKNLSQTKSSLIKSTSENQNVTSVTNDSTITSLKNQAPIDPDNEDAYNYEQNMPEFLVLSEDEISLMQTLSKLIGNNPRAIKRFVNIYRIVRTHETVSIEDRNKKTELITIMFLIALSVGLLKENYKKIILKLTSYDISKTIPNSTIHRIDLSALLDDPAQDIDTRNFKDLLNPYINNQKEGKIIKKIPLNSIFKYVPLINRFTFKSI